MKKKLVLLLISCITLETLLSGCSIPFLSHGDSSVDATEEALDLQDTSAYPIEEIMSYIHINEEQYVVGGDEIPEEYFTLVDTATNSKGLKCLIKPLQLSPFWRCNILQKYFATFANLGLQKTAYGLDLYEYLNFLFENRPNKDMSDDELDKLAPWNEAVKELCKIK